MKSTSCSALYLLFSIKKVKKNSWKYLNMYLTSGYERNKTSWEAGIEHVQDLSHQDDQLNPENASSASRVLLCSHTQLSGWGWRKHMLFSCFASRWDCIFKNPCKLGVLLWFCINKCFVLQFLIKKRVHSASVTHRAYICKRLFFIKSLCFVWLGSVFQRCFLEQMVQGSGLRLQWFALLSAGKSPPSSW